MGQQLITVGPDGVVFGLQSKRGKGLDLRQLGKGWTRRVTLIERDDDTGWWRIDWTNDGMEQAGVEDPNRTWDGAFFRKLGVGWEFWDGRIREDGVVEFENYDDAVKAEVSCIQAMQINGAIGPVSNNI